MADSSARSWFCVWNNPEWHIFYRHDTNGNLIFDNEHKPIEDHREKSILNGLSPEEICEKINDIWCNGSETRTCACCYCISSNGLHHLHFVPCDTEKFRFSKVKQAFPSAHIEETRGTKQQAENYILKKGAFEEKGEVIVCTKYHGEICSNQGKRSDLDEIEQLINDGYTPDQITSKGIRYLSKEKLIKNAFYKKRMKETPILRNVEVYYHYGLSGSGKSYYMTLLCGVYGEQEVYFCGNYDNGFLDEYNGQRILFLDEFRGQIRFATLLSICQGYRQYYHARNHNILGLWNEVHITSVIPPELLYHNRLDNDKHDVIDQFMRRITGVYYHYQDKKTNEYKSKYIPKEKYNGFDSMFVEESFTQLSFLDKTNLPF